MKKLSGDQISEQQNNPFQQSAPQLSTQKSYFLKEYMQKMPSLSPQRIQSLSNKLEDKNFVTTSGEYHSFSANIIKIDQNSILYQVIYGFYKTNISVFIGNINITNLKRDEIGEGANSKAYIIKRDTDFAVLKSSQELLRNIYVDQKYLREVFFSKFASALSIGPEFYQSYGYDMVKLNHKFQFMMQLCQNDRSFLDTKDSQKFKADILENLSILHHFHGIHHDIKPENIGWSSVKNKYILFDFGFSIFISEPIGYKTYTHFKGTYHFASKEMMSIFILKNAKYIDLYYNDLIGVIKSLQIPPLCKTKKQSSTDLLINQEKADQQNNLIRFFKFCYLMFIEDEEEAQKMVASEKVLAMSFRKVVQIYITEEQLISKYIKYLNEQLQKVYQKLSYEQILDLEVLDSIIYKELSKQKCIMCEGLEINEKNIEALYLLGKFSLIWYSQVWTETIFKYLFQKDSTITKIQKQILQFISQTTSNHSPSLTQIYFGALGAFKEYFKDKKYVKYLFVIKEIYFITAYITQEIQLRHQIWDIIAQLDNKFACLDCIYQQFCGYLAYQYYTHDWIFFLNRLHIQNRSVNEIFKLCIKILSLLNDLKIHTSKIDSLQELIDQFQFHITEEVQRGMFIKIKKIFGLIKKKLKRQFIAKENFDIKSIVENVYEKDIVYDGVGIPLPKKTQSHFQFLYCHRFIIFKGIRSNKQKYKQLIELYINYSPALSQVQTIWKYGLYLLNQRPKSAHQLFTQYMLENINSPIQSLKFFLEYFFRIMGIGLPESKNAFEGLLTTIGNIEGDTELRQIDNPLKMVNKLVQQLCSSFSFLKNKAKYNCEAKQIAENSYNCISYCLKLICQIQGQNIQKIQQIIDWITIIYTILFRNLNTTVRSSETEEQRNHIMYMMKNFQLSYELDDCWALLYETIDLIKSFSSSELISLIQQETYQYFHEMESQNKLLIFKMSESINTNLQEYFIQNKMFQEYIQFLLHLNRCSQNIYLSEAMVNQVIQQISIKQLVNFSTNKFAIQPLVLLHSRFILFFLVYTTIKKLLNSLPYDIQQRMIILLSHGNSINFISLQYRRLIKVFILKWQRINKIKYSERVRFINFRTQMLSNCECEYRKFCWQLLAKAKKSKFNEHRQIFVFFKDKVKKADQQMQKLLIQERNKKLKEVLDAGLN